MLFYDPKITCLSHVTPGRGAPVVDRKPLVFKDKREAIDSFKEFLKEKVSPCVNGDAARDT